jgi:hypothetical protein
MATSSPLPEINCLTSWDRKGMTCAQIAFSLLTISACKKERERKRERERSNKEKSQLVTDSQNINRMILNTLYILAAIIS